MGVSGSDAVDLTRRVNDRLHAVVTANSRWTLPLRILALSSSQVNDQRRLLKKIVSKKIWQHGFMEAFADAVGLRAFGFGARVVDVLDREIELANGRATLRAKFASSIPRARHSQ
jgi:hypothetical protein